MLYNIIIEELRRYCELLKSTFAKYMIAFITVLLISFIVLSSIVTGVVREHVQKDQENKLFKTSTAIANHIENLTFSDLNSAILTGIVPKSIYPLINSYDDIHVIVTDNTNKILLTTVNASITDYGRIPLTISQGELGNLDFGKFELIDEEENKHFCFEGKDEGIYNERIQLCARPIVSDGSEIGCVTVFISTEREEFVVQSAKEAVTNNALWIMLDAVIAVYFITERIINPLKNKTQANNKAEDKTDEKN